MQYFHQKIEMIIYLLLARVIISVEIIYQIDQKIKDFKIKL